MPKETPATDAVPVNKAVLAAGAVLWRSDGDSSEPEVAVIHRPRYDDWSLPKGKVDPGETETVDGRAGGATRRRATARTSAGGWRR